MRKCVLVAGTQKLHKSALSSSFNESAFSHGNICLILSRDISRLALIFFCFGIFDASVYVALISQLGGELLEAVSMAFCFVYLAFCRKLVQHRHPVST